MSPEQKDLLAEAEVSLKAARYLFDGGYYGYAVSRAYYAMFYLAEAILLLQGKAFSKHSGVIAAFAKDYIVPGLLPQHLHRYLREGLQFRQRADYIKDKPIGQETAEEQIRRAEEFFAAVKAFLEANQPSS